MKSLKYLPIVGFVCAVCSCSNPKQKSTEAPKKNDTTVVAADTLFLLDKNFAHLHLTNSEDVKMIYKQSNAGDYGNDVYTDSTFTKKYTMLTNGQKKQLLWDFFDKDIGGDVKPDFFEKFMQAYFVAKQPSVNGFQPIILSLSGDDYHALTMVLLDKSNKPVNSFKLTEGMLSGPIEEGDSLLVMQTMRQSIMKGDIIITKEVTQSDFADSLKRPSLVDSVVFRTVIDKGGNFKTKKFSTSHYTVPYHP